MKYNLVVPAGGPPNYRPPIDLALAEFQADSDDLAIEKARRVSEVFTTIPTSQKSLVLKQDSRVVCQI